MSCSSHSKIYGSVLAENLVEFVLNNSCPFHFPVPKSCENRVHLEQDSQCLVFWLDLATLLLNEHFMKFFKDFHFPILERENSLQFWRPFSAPARCTINQKQTIQDQWSSAVWVNELSRLFPSHLARRLCPRHRLFSIQLKLIASFTVKSSSQVCVEQVWARAKRNQ